MLSDVTSLGILVINSVITDLQFCQMALF